VNPRPLRAGTTTSAPETGAPSTRKEPLGFFFLLLLVWLGFEYGRPANPMYIPLLISAALFIRWIVARDRRWSRQSWLLVAFLAVMAAGVALAGNTYSAFWGFYGMATVLGTICLPLPSLVTSVRAVRVWIYAFLAVSLYVGVWAIFNHGYGPSGASGGQDENYVAAMMGMAVSFAYFSIFAAKSRVLKVALVGSILIFLAAVAAGYNVSRGGFIGLCAVLLYCLAKSPRKWVGVVVVVLIVAVVVPFVGPAYWEEIATIGDTTEGTADLRMEIWQIGIRMWQANPVFGVGADNFRWAIGDYQSPEQHEKFDRSLGGSIIAHSLFVELLAELGTLGALVLLLLLWRTWKDLRQVVRAPDVPRELRCYADGLICAVLACLVNGVFLSLLYYSYLWLFISLGSAMWQIWRASIQAPRAA
jgi:O-antigen ligase